MKMNGKRVLSLILIVAMVFTLSLAAFAAEGQSGPIYDTVWTPSNPTPPPAPGPAAPEAPKTLEVLFNGGAKQEGTLEVPAESLDENGDYSVTVTRGSVVPPEKVPGVTPADRYYSFAGWVLEEDYEKGNLNAFIDLETYVPTEKVKLIAVYLDSWVPYRDMKQDRSDWFYQFVRDLSIAGVVNGTPDGDFLPLKALTYGEALKLVMLASGYDVQLPTDAHWASGYYAKALADGLVDETGIDLESSITRREVAEITVRALRLPDATIETPFADTALPVALAMYEAGLMIGTENAEGETVFMPESDITRAEISTIVWRIYHYAENAV